MILIITIKVLLELLSTTKVLLLKVLTHTFLCSFSVSISEYCILPFLVNNYTYLLDFHSIGQVLIQYCRTHAAILVVCHEEKIYMARSSIPFTVNDC